jgi:hypothetical protein
MEGITLTDLVDLMILRFDGPNLTVPLLEQVWSRRDSLTDEDEAGT